jgi:hypothetical protein
MTGEFQIAVGLLTMVVTSRSDVENPRECCKDPVDSSGFYYIEVFTNKNDEGNEEKNWSR